MSQTFFVNSPRLTSRPDPFDPDDEEEEDLEDEDPGEESFLNIWESENMSRDWEGDSDLNLCDAIFDLLLPDCVLVCSNTLYAPVLLFQLT